VLLNAFVWVKHKTRKFLCHCVELQGEGALSVRGCILVHDTASGSLVNLLHNKLVSLGSSGLVAGVNCGIELLDYGAKLSLDHLVLESLGLDDFDALLSGLDVCHFDNLLFQM